MSEQSRREQELRNLRRLRRLLREIMEAGEILLMSSTEKNNELIKLSNARGVE